MSQNFAKSASGGVPSVSVVIVNFNGEEFISSCIGSVLAQEPVPEIVVVDNGSTDHSVSMVRELFPQVRIVLNSKNLGFAGPANQGAEAATGDLLLFLNNDARLMPTTLSTLVDALQANSKVAACQPTMMKTEGGFDSAGSMFTKTGFLHHVTDHDLASNRFGSFRFSLNGACLLVWTELFLGAGGFDASYFAYFEESDLCWRLLSMGYVVEHVENAFAVHDTGRTTGSIFPSNYIDFLSFRNRITTIRKNGDRRLKLRVLPVHVVCCLGVSVAFVLNGKPRNAAGIVRALLWHLRPIINRSRSEFRSVKPVSLEFLATSTVPFSSSAAIRMLKAYLLRW
jgi:GT2 family glycosyltransferase